MNKFFTNNWAGADLRFNCSNHDEKKFQFDHFQTNGSNTKVSERLKLIKQSTDLRKSFTDPQQWNELVKNQFLAWKGWRRLISQLTPIKKYSQWLWERPNHTVVLNLLFLSCRAFYWPIYAQQLNEVSSLIRLNPKWLISSLSTTNFDILVLNDKEIAELPMKLNARTVWRHNQLS